MRRRKRGAGRARQGGQRPDERILQLLLLLLEAGRPVSRDDIFDAIPAYRTRVASAGERKFERDKKELRELGVPIEDAEDQPNSYVVHRRAYELPSVSLAEDERAALALAAEAVRGWDGLAYAELIDGALRKLCWDSDGAGARLPPNVAVALPARRAKRGLRKHVAELTRAVEARKRVTLGYRTADGEATERIVDPYALVYSRGDWLLVGHCHLRDAPRTFRVDRVMRVKVAGRPGTPDFERPANWNTTLHLQRSPWVFQAGVSGAADVVLEIGPERGWIAGEDFGPAAAREEVPASVAGEPGWTRVRFRCGNPDYVVTRVLDGAGHVRVVAPEDLRERVRRTAEAIAARYAGGGAG